MRIRRPAPSTGSLLANAVVVTVGVAIVAGVVTGVTAGPQWLPLAFLGATAAGTLVATVIGYVYREKEVLLDWEANRARFRLGRCDREFPLDAIRRIRLQGRTRTRSSGGRVPLIDRLIDAVQHGEHLEPFAARPELSRQVQPPDVPRAFPGNRSRASTLTG